LHEDWAILESVFASRKAITDLHKSGKESDQHTSSSASTSSPDDPAFEPGAHGRNLSIATGVDTLTIDDILPPSDKKKKEDALARRFSKRGVRLAVHNSILNLDTRDVPSSLRKRWIHAARQRQSHGHNDRGSPSIAQLSRISEVDSYVFSDSHPPPPLPLYRQNPDEDQKIDMLTRRKTDSTATSEKVSKARKRSQTLMASPIGQTLSKAIQRLAGVGHGDKDKEKTQASDKKENEKSDTGEKPPRQGWSYRLTKPFMQPELTTPDYNEDCEGNALL
jgi:hypothetical protein